MRRERIMDKLTVTQQEQTDSEEQRIAKAVAERDTKQAQQQREEEEKKAAMLESIAAHREFLVTHVQMLHLQNTKLLEHKAFVKPLILNVYLVPSHLCGVVTCGLKNKFVEYFFVA